MRSFLHRTLGLSILAALTAISCTKQEHVAPASTEAEVAFNPKNGTFFLRNDPLLVGPTYRVYKWTPSCVTPYGMIGPAAEALANTSNIILGSPSYLRVIQNAYCNDDSQSCWFQRGSAVNSFGPWYLIYPQSGPPASTRKGIKIRVKNLAAPSANAYQASMTYNSSTNTWNVAAANASGNFEVQVITPGIMTLCQNHVPG